MNRLAILLLSVSSTCCALTQVSGRLEQYVEGGFVPAADVAVSLRQPQSEERIGPVISGKDGSYALTGVAPGNWLLDVWTGGITSQPVEHAVAIPDEREFELPAFLANDVRFVEPSPARPAAVGQRVRPVIAFEGSRGASIWLAVANQKWPDYVQPVCLMHAKGNMLVAEREFRLIEGDVELLAVLVAERAGEERLTGAVADSSWMPARELSVAAKTVARCPIERLPRRMGK